MRISSCLPVCFFAVCLCAACSSKPKAEGAGEGLHVVTKTEQPRLVPERMPLSDVTNHVHFGGKDYETRVFRSADETLPRVKDQDGQEFIDNRIRLRVSTGGRILLDRSFTKADFATLVEARMLEHSLLEGMVYDTVSARGLIFAASVSYPQSDLYVPIRLFVAPDGRVMMERSDLLEEDGAPSADE